MHEENQKVESENAEVQIIAGAGKGRTAKIKGSCKLMSGDFLLTIEFSDGTTTQVLKSRTQPFPEKTSAE